MAENVFTAGFFRLPIVMMAVNRTLGPPWNIWVDHGDTLALRDAGWVQLYCQDNQEVADATLCAFRLAEDSQVLLPVLVCQDAFVLSHTAMLTEFPTQDAVDRFLPELALPHRVSDKPVVVGGLDFPHETEVHRRHQAEAMDATFDAWERVSDAFEAEFGRRPAAAVQSYRAEDADTLLVCMGTTAATARAAADAARERGERVGVVRVFMFRPFPEVALRAALADAQRIAVIDRDMCPGLGGILWSELRPAAPPEALVQNYLVGLGGGDVREKHLDWILKDVSERSAAGAPQLMEVG